MKGEGIWEEWVQQEFGNLEARAKPSLPFIIPCLLEEDVFLLPPEWMLLRLGPITWTCLLEKLVCNFTWLRRELIFRPRQMRAEALWGLQAEGCVCVFSALLQILIKSEGAPAVEIPRSYVIDHSELPYSHLKNVVAFCVLMCNDSRIYGMYKMGSCHMY